jgi:hypothetical protein
MSPYDLYRQQLKNGVITKPVKEKKPIPKMSAKRKVDQKEYVKIVKEKLKTDDRCKIKSSACTGKAQGLHHLIKRSPNTFLKEDNLIEACNACNSFLESNDKWARTNGFVKSKFIK